MRIAICDDMSDELERICKLVNEYVEINDLDVHIKTFSHPDNLLKWSECENFQLYILDVVMPMMSGLQLGKEIRMRDCEAQIIYITSAPEYALDSFSVNPLNYIIKPVDKKKIFDTLSLAISKIKADGVTLTLKSKKGLHTISMASIVYCEYVNHSVKYILTKGEIIETTTIKSNFSEHVAPILMDKRFIKTHSSFVVNMNLVERLSRDGFTMRGGAFVPVSGKMFTEVKKAYISFRLKDGITA